MNHLFVLGTLKRGFPLHHHLEGAIFEGAWETVERFPLIVAGKWFAPMLLNEPGQGKRILGELYSVSTDTLARLDKVESIGEPGNYRLEVEINAGPEITVAYAYFKSRDLASPIYSGYLSSYEDTRFIPQWKRGSA
jgi:gamma-glutamylaminecyclotransferase